MALTLLEASKINSGDIKRSAVIEMFAENSDIMRVLPFIDIPGGSYSYTQEGTLPGVAFRGINEAYAATTGVLNPLVEILRIAGGDLDVDRALIKTRGEQVRTQQESMKVKALALNITGKIVNGDSDVDPREFDGLRKRIVGAQLVPADHINAPSASDALSLASLDKAIDQVDNPTHLLMSKAMRRHLTTASRNTAVGGYITYDQDEFGRRVTMYSEIPILIADFDATGARIIDFNEAGPAGGAVSTSLYVLSMGEDKITGLQNGVMEVEDLGEIDAQPVLRTRVEWLVGLAALHGRAAARVWGITDAAVTV